MRTNSNCPKCGKLLHENASETGCAECVLGMLEEFTDAPTEINQSTFEDFPLSESICSQADPVAFGDYDLIEEIARGGMGVVYKARQRSLNRVVAVKVILAGRFAGKQMIQRFRGEVMAAALLEHPNIVAVLEVGMHQGQHFFSMNYVAGKNLAEIAGNHPFPAMKAARYVQKIAEAIHYAHGQGILHRDLKPSNVLIDNATDEPRVTDFGLAKQIHGESSLTITGQVLGSPNFMPPEQASGNRGKVGKPSDVYGLGAILYYLLTARAPFQAESLEGLITEVMNNDVLSPRALNRNLPLDLETICLKCLEKEPARRYQTAQELADELERFQRDEPIHARPVTSAERLWRRCRRNPVLASMSAAIVLLALIFAFGLPIAYFRIKNEKNRAESESKLRRTQLYATEVDLAGVALANDDMSRARDLLNRQWPEANSTNDLRGFEWRYLYGKSAGEETATLGRHDNAVKAIAFSPLERDTLLASWEADGTVKLWDYQARKLIGVLRHAPVSAEPWQSSSAALAFSSDGQLLAAGQGRDIVLWNVQTRTRRALLQGKNLVVNALVLTRDNKTLISGTQDGVIQFWDISTAIPSQITSIQTALICVYKLALGQNDQILVASGHISAPAAWNISQRTNPIIFPFPEEHTAWISAFAFAPRTNILVSSGTGGDVIAWSFTGNDHLLSSRKLPMPRGSLGIVNSFVFAGDPNRMVSAGTDGNITVWDLSGAQSAIKLRGHNQGVHCLAVTADGRTIASGGMDGSVKLWDIDSAWRKQQAPPAMAHSRWMLGVAFSPDGKLLASVAAGEALKLWDTETEQLVVERQTRAVGADRLVFSPDGKFLAAEEEGTIHLRTLPSLEDAEKIAGCRPLFSETIVELIYFRPEGKRGGIHWRNLKTGTERVCAVEFNSTALMALSPDGRRVAAVDGNRIIMAAHEGGIASVTEVGKHTDVGRVWSIAFSPDGQLLASAGWDGAVHLWDLENPGKIRHPLKAHHGRAWAVAFSPDGRTLATGGDDGTIRLWNLASLQQAGVIEAHTGPVDGLAFSRDGTKLASCSGDGTVRIWRAPTLEQIADEQYARKDGAFSWNASPASYER